MGGRSQQRVLMTADTLGGVWSYAVELARALDRRGIRVDLATMGAPLTLSQRTQLTGMRWLTLHESSYKLEWMQRAWADVDRAGEWLLALEREVAPDLVHLNQFAFGALPFAAPTLVVAHSCVLSWWRAVHGEAAPAAWDRYRRRVGQGLAGAGLVAAPTRAMLQTLVHNYGYDQPGVVLSNGRSGADFRPGAKQPCILAAGRLWDEGKNLALLEAVAPQVPWPVRLAGPTSHPDGGSVLPSWVYCLGELSTPALAQQLAAAAIYALPARYEPFGLSVLEAALSGCALVLGDIPSLREVWGAAALYVGPDDRTALQETLARLMERPSEVKRLGLAARARALHFTPERMATAYLRAYAQLVPGFASVLGREMQCA
jgi:glycosyltransferase involved in cell wall biosynthesis